MIPSYPSRSGPGPGNWEPRGDLPPRLTHRPEYHIVRGQMGAVILKKKRDESLRRRHPWIFAGSVRQVENVGGDGETVAVLSAAGRRLARGAYSSRSQIRVRVWSFDPERKIDPAFFRRRIRRALEARTRLGLDDPQGGCRLINSESDGLPGVIVDRYAGFLVCQFLSAGAEYWKREVTAELQARLRPTGVYERSDSAVRTREGLVPQVGTLSGERPPAQIEIREGPLRILVNVRTGHKTGFYLDQRENRAAVAEFGDRAEVLNCFSFSGAFGLWALHGGAARVTHIDTSAEALELSRQNMACNGLAPELAEHVAGDVFTVLRRYRDAARSFDLAILDPPKFAASAHQVERAARGYKDINLLAIKLLRPGGVLFTFSCSGHMEPRLFQKIVADAALDAGRRVQIIRWLWQAPDHPVALNFPEAAYLKGLVCRVW